MFFSCYPTISVKVFKGTLKMTSKIVYVLILHSSTTSTTKKILPKHTHTIILLLFWNLSGNTQVSRYQIGKTRKGTTNLDLLEQEIVSGSGICWAIRKSALHPQTTTPTSHHSVF